MQQQTVVYQDLKLIFDFTIITAEPFERFHHHPTFRALNSEYSPINNPTVQCIQDVWGGV